MTTFVSTVTKGVGTVVSERLVDFEIDFSSISRCAMASCSARGACGAAWVAVWRPRWRSSAAALARALGLRMRVPEAGCGGCFGAAMTLSASVVYGSCMCQKCACSQCTVRLYAWPMACSGRVWDVPNGASHNGVSGPA